MTDRIILNIEDWSNATLAVRAARYLIDNPDKPDCLLEYGDSNSPPRMWAKRGKSRDDKIGMALIFWCVAVGIAVTLFK